MPPISQKLNVSPTTVHPNAADSPRFQGEGF